MTLVLAILLVVGIPFYAGLTFGRAWERDRGSNRELDEADREIAALHALDRIHGYSTSA